MPEDHATDSSAGRDAVENAIWAARPPFVIPAARDAIDAWLGLTGAEVLLIDYHQSHLVPFGDGTGGSAITATAPPAGQAYASARPVRDGDHLYVPLAVYGERIGVLSIR